MPGRPPDSATIERLKRAFASYQAGNLPDAARLYQNILARDPNNFPALNMLGVIAARTRAYADAIRYLTRALAANPQAVEVYINLGRIQAECQDYPGAIATLGKALAIDPRHPVANNNYGLVLSAVERHDDALLHIGRATSVAADYADAWHNQGNVLSKMRRFKDAFRAYDTAFRLDPQAEETEGARLFAKMQICDWSNFESERSRLVESIRDGKLSAPPLKMLALTSDPGEQLQCARLYDRRNPGPAPLPFVKKARTDDRIRIAYVSHDFRPHPVAYLIAGLIEAHDRTRFDVIGVSLQPDDPSAIGQRLKGAFDRFVDVSKHDDATVVRLLRDLDVDIAVDLMGYTNGNRRNIFAMRAAPIQVSYLGYLGTLGADFIDYMIADRIVVPASHRPYYTEKIACLPSYQVNDRKRVSASGTLSRADVGLPADGMVFCCFNNNYKISPATYGSWMSILRQVDHAVLWLHADNDDVVRHLKAEASARGIADSRIVLSKPAPYAEYLARYRLADLFLDTHPQNAGATASDALWEGLPVLTRIGETLAGRIAASALTAVGLPELITQTPDEYERRAIALATQPVMLQTVKQKLEKNRLTTPLFDTQAFTRHIESAYRAMHERHHAGLRPDHLEVSG
jgi:predicted O-linked N-acetylglucosamine transferase (SPINDLY family)